MKVRTNRLDKPDRTTSERQRRSLFAAAAIVLAGSLVLVVTGGWLKSGGLKVAISGLGAVLFIGALAGDLSHARLFDAAISKWNSATTGLDSHSRLPHCDHFYRDRGLASDCFVARGNAKQLPVLSSAEHASRLLRASGKSVLVRGFAMDYGSFLFLALIGFQTRTTLFLGGLGVSSNPGDS